MIGMDKVLLASRGSAGEPAPEGVSFDGVNDYLSRSSDLVGNTDSKTFTFSCWVYRTISGAYTLYGNHLTGSTRYVFFDIKSNGSIDFYCRNAAGANIFRVETGSSNVMPLNTLSHILLSVDLTDTSKRHLYLNDTPWVSASWLIYDNDTINFTAANHQINGYYGANAQLKGRLSHLFLDYQYRDLSIEANRRLFSVEV